MNEAVEPIHESSEQKRPGPFALGFLLFAGVILPLAALLVELTIRWCAREFFDPIPTWWHVLLVAFVPVTNLQIWIALHKEEISRPGWLSFASAVSLFISVFYTLVFAPLLPIAVFAILLFLLGLLPLAPLFSLIAGVFMRLWMKRFYPADTSSLLHWKALAAGFLFVATVFGIAEFSFSLTRLGIAKANSSDPTTQAEGVSLLKRFGDVDHILRIAYDGNAAVSSEVLVKPFMPVDHNADQERSLSKQAQKAYYRMTGQSYRQVAVPRGIRNWENVERFENLDADGSVRVGTGLSLAASQIDASVDADAALGYLEWTLVFKNQSTGQREAISQIQMPPGAVASRLTLWINGEEREAAFAKSSKVIEAYDKVTARRLDPALVTVTGKDRIQLKCFPVPSNGEMKVRIGFTVPVVLETTSTGFLALPYFQDRNFLISTEHSIWVESKREIAIANPAFKHEKGENLFGVRGRVNDKGLAAFRSPIKINRPPEIRTAWAKDSLTPGTIIKQDFREVARPAVRKIVLVVDPSASMAPFQEQIVGTIQKLPADMPFALVLSGGNGLNVDSAAPASFSGTSAEVAERIRAARFEGGTDPVSAIETAWELGHAEPGSAIVWIHGPQPVELDSPIRLSQLWKRRPTEVPVYSLQIGTGKNPVERSLNESDAVSTVLRFGEPGDDLTRLFTNLITQKISLSAVRTGQRKPPPASPTTKETSQHLVRLWANDESLKLLRSGSETEAIDLAVKNQLVTRVSGAVVLETKQQYDQFGLKPVDPNSVPTIPEPEEYLLFGVIVFTFAFFFWRFRRTSLGTS